jgi:hypothetical protein
MLTGLLLSGCGDRHGLFRGDGGSGSALAACWPDPDPSPGKETCAGVVSPAAAKAGLVKNAAPMQSASMARWPWMGVGIPLLLLSCRRVAVVMPADGPESIIGGNQKRKRGAHDGAPRFIRLCNSNYSVSFTSSPAPPA